MVSTIDVPSKFQMGLSQNHGITTTPKIHDLSYMLCFSVYSMVFHVSAYEIHGFPLLRKTARRCFLDARSRPHSHPAAMEEVAPLDVKKTCFLLDEREIKH